MSTKLEDEDEDEEGSQTLPGRVTLLRADKQTRIFHQTVPTSASSQMIKRSWKTHPPSPKTTHPNGPTLLSFSNGMPANLQTRTFRLHQLHRRLHHQATTSLHKKTTETTELKHICCIWLFQLTVTGPITLGSDFRFVSAIAWTKEAQQQILYHTALRTEQSCSSAPSQRWLCRIMAWSSGKLRAARAVS